MGSIAYEDYAHPIISERAIDESRPIKVIYIGAGISGICAAIQFPRYVPNVELVIYEKNADVGGTWFENRYPGCACDIPAHSYQLSFESSLEWTQFYAGAPEIFKYWQRIADKYDIRKLIKFGHRCVEARWNETTSQWHVKLQDLESGEIFEDVGDVFMTGVGVLNEWKWPDVKGLHDFKGTLLHSANYDQNFDATDKTIAVLGAGSSGIQIVPTLQPKVKSMDHYVRGRTWIAATFGHDLVEERTGGQDGNFTYTEAEREAWRKDPASYLQYRKALEIGMQGGYAVTHRGTTEHDMARAAFTQDMTRRLNAKPEIINHLLPDFPPLCKRLTPGPGYLEALTSPKVNVIPTAISHIDATGIVDANGTHRPVDAIICATGFNTSFQGRIPIYGRDSTNLQTRYQARPETYLSMATDGFPNFFQALGPNAGLGNGNLMIIIEAITLYMTQVLQRLSMGNTLTVEPKKECVLNFTNYCDAYFKRTVFSAECGSWYKSSPPGTSAQDQKRGRVTALWPGSSIHAVRALEKVRWEDYNTTTRDGNDFGWFGDGWAVAERPEAKDEGSSSAQEREGLCWYLNGGNILEDELDRKAPRVGGLAEGVLNGVTINVKKEHILNKEEKGEEVDPVVGQEMVPGGYAPG